MVTTRRFSSSAANRLLWVMPAWLVAFGLAASLSAQAEMDHSGHMMNMAGMLDKYPNLRPDLMLWVPNILYQILGLTLCFRFGRT